MKTTLNMKGNNPIFIKTNNGVQQHPPYLKFTLIIYINGNKIVAKESKHVYSCYTDDLALMAETENKCQRGILQARPDIVYRTLY